MENTIIIFVVTLLFSLPLGLMGCLFKKVKFTPFKKIKNCKFNPLKFILDIYTWVIRGTPLLLQLFVVYFGLPIIFGEKFSFISERIINFCEQQAFKNAKFRRGAC